MMIKSKDWKKREGGKVLEEELKKEEKEKRNLEGKEWIDNSKTTY